MKTLYAASAAILGVACTTPPLMSAIDTSPNEVRGPARVIDGDTIEINGRRIRLWGIDAPERDQSCTNRDSQPYPCGQSATRAMQTFIDASIDKKVHCKVVDTDKYKRLIAICTVDVDTGQATRFTAGGLVTQDLGAGMVGYGWAVDYTYYSKGAYKENEDQARRLKMGIHQGPFNQPADYRHGAR